MANCQGIDVINSKILKGFLMDKALDLKRMIHRSRNVVLPAQAFPLNQVYPILEVQEAFGQKWPLYNFKTF